MFLTSSVCLAKYLYNQGFALKCIKDGSVYCDLYRNERSDEELETAAREALVACQVIMPPAAAVGIKHVRYRVVEGYLCE